MSPVTRTLKRAVILGVFVFIVGGLLYFVAGYFKAPPVVPVATPTFAPLDVVSTQLFPVTGMDYDLLIRLRNPNPRYGAPDFKYDLVFYNDKGLEVARLKDHASYILPGQTKYIIESPIRLDVTATRFNIELKSITWEELDPLAAGTVNLVLTPPQYTKLNQPTVFAQVSSNVVNNSSFDLNKIDVVVVANNAAGQAIAVNKTQMTTVLSDERRNFISYWFTPFFGDVANIEAEAYTNAFLNSTFVKTYGQNERFQQYLEK